MDNLRLRNESGFTLIELLVVVAIIGILAAIAIPQFSAYRKRGYEAQVKSDLRNAATAQEAYFTQAFTYKGGAMTGTRGEAQWPAIPKARAHRGPQARRRTVAGCFLCS